LILDSRYWAEAWQSRQGNKRDLKIKSANLIAQADALDSLMNTEVF